jgi:UDP-N-acetylmuramoyl-L-alanyl-D-glutamate--2,6-diaminopimelate ligase
VRGIAADNRRVEQGFLFLAVPGATSHGMAFAEAAVNAGAVAIAADPFGAPGIAQRLPVPVIEVPGLGGMLGDIANRFWDTPSAAVDVYGITGTNGKTTVAWLLAEVLERLGHGVGYVGTLGAGLGRIAVAPGLTTPGVIELHARIAEFRDAGARKAAIEVSSHALVQGRVDGIRFRSALFTNLGRDHLDYHGSMPAYFAAKSRLFTDCAPETAIVNVDTEWGRALAARCGDDVITVSTRQDLRVDGKTFLRVSSMTATEAGSVVQVESAWGRFEFSLPLPGDFNIANAALVIAALLSEGQTPDDLVAALGKIKPPPGRLERIPGPGPSVYVDFAHTPDALETVLYALRPHVRRRLTVVFGAGGDRDTGKRPLMGRIAERLADTVVLTSDNPRTERPLAIIEAIRRGMEDRDKAVVFEDRAGAIEWAIANAAASDTVLIAGKGHELTQQIGTEKRPFSDAALAAEVLASWRGVSS